MPTVIYYVYYNILAANVKHVAYTICDQYSCTYKVNVKQSRYRPRVFQEVKVPRFRDKGTGWW